MSNAGDDPGRRPPSPRQGESQPYTGSPYPGDAPPYGGDPYQGNSAPYGGPPHPGGQQPSYPGGGYTPTSPSYPPPPADPLPGGYPGPYPSSSMDRRADGKGFFASLFDLNFDHMVTTRIIKIVYVLAIMVFSLVSLFTFLVGLWALQFSWGKYVGVFLVPAAPLLWLLELVTVRLALEFVINQFKITEHLKAIREQREPR